MARKSPTILQEELYSPDEAILRDDDARSLDLDVEEEAPFLRAQKRVSVRRSTLPKKTATRLLWVGVGLTALFLCALAASAAYHYGEHDWRFRIVSSDDIDVAGLQNVTRSQIMEVMGGDIGRNIFFIPLSQRKAQLEQIPWVQSASVMRFVPNRLKIEIHERTAVAFARIGSKILLVDAAGTLMDLPPRKTYSFPVIVGMGQSEPASTRQARMEIYNDLIRQLDDGGARYSQDLSEVDLNDPEDVKVLVAGPDGDVLLHLGSSDYLNRYKIYASHVQEWRQQFSKIDSVDLRYNQQIVVNPDLGNLKAQPPLSADAAKAAMAAGVKHAALVNYEHIAAKASAEASVRINPLDKPATAKAEVKLSAGHTIAKSLAVKRATARPAHRIVAAKTRAKSKYSVSATKKPVRRMTTQPVKHVERASLRTATRTTTTGTTVTTSKSKKPSPSIR
jgi:cell division protein FtsQ